MKVSGQLNLKRSNDDYLIFGGGRNVNLSEYFNVQLLEKVKVKIVNRYSGQVLFDSVGKLVKQKTAPKYYQYFIDDVNIDEILWNHVGLFLNIEVVNVS